MIRINLLPTRDAPRRQAAVAQVVAFLVVLAVGCVALAMLYTIQKGEIREQQRANGVIESRIKRIQSHIEDHDQIRSRIEEIEGKQNVITELQARRTGPVFVMAELAKVLSRNGSPTFDHDWYMDYIRRSPGQAYHPDWDGRRLWLQRFTEEDREVELNGQAMSHEDVAEFLRRLALSDFFHEVTLVSTRTADSTVAAAAETGIGLVAFEIRCRLRYAGGSHEEESEVEPQPAAGSGHGHS